MGSWRRVLIILVLCSGLGLAEESPPARVILLSWDGAPYWLVSRLLSEGRLPGLQRLAREGGWSDGMITSFPGTTAAAHAIFWTGTFGHTNGVTGNQLLVEPAAEHSRLESRSGYFSDALRVDPIWVLTARRGLATYTFHATQSYPFEKYLDGLAPSERKSLHQLCAYTGASVSAEAFSDEKATAPAQGWVIPEAASARAREFRFQVGDSPFWGLFFDDPIDPTQGYDTLGVVGDKGAAAFSARLKPGSSQPFSAPIAASFQGRTLWFTLRLFELEPATCRFLVYRSSAQAVFVSSEDFPRAQDLSVQAFAGNGATSVYQAGGLGPTLPQGGTGEAEDRYLETLADLTRQLWQQSEEVLSRGEYRLLLLYSPVPDELGHTFAGYLDPSVQSHDPALEEKFWPKLITGFEQQDEVLARVLEGAARTGADVILVSDHGMAGTDRRLNVNIALAHAGLLALTPERTIDLSRTRALLLPLSDGSVAVNTKDRKGGIVPLDDKGAVIEEVRQTLEALEDPATGQSIVKGLFETSREGLLQPGGPTTGDLFLDLAPGYDVSSGTEEDEIVSLIPPQGVHNFVPTRRDMLAICGAWGPHVPAGIRWGRVRAIDILPTILKILGVEKPADLPGVSLLPPTSLVHPASRGTVRWRSSRLDGTSAGPAGSKPTGDPLRTGESDGGGPCSEAVMGCSNPDTCPVPAAHRSRLAVFCQWIRFTEQMARQLRIYGRGGRSWIS